MKFIAAGVALCALLAGCGGDDEMNGATTVPGARSEPSTATSSTTVNADAGGVDLVTAFRVFARGPSPRTAAAVGFASKVAVGLGADILTIVDDAGLTVADRWVLDPEAGFRGHSGPFDLLSYATSAEDVTVAVGDHPHCASPPVPPPADLVNYRRISFQPELPADASCLQWWTVDLFVDEESDVRGVTLDLWEP